MFAVVTFLALQKRRRRSQQEACIDMSLHVALFVVKDKVWEVICVACEVGTVLFCYWILLNLDTFLDLTVRTLDWKFSFCERARSDVTNYLTFVASHVMQSAQEKNNCRFTDEKSWAAR